MQACKLPNGNLIQLLFHKGSKMILCPGCVFVPATWNNSINRYENPVTAPMFVLSDTPLCLVDIAGYLEGEGHHRQISMGGACKPCSMDNTCKYQ